MEAQTKFVRPSLKEHIIDYENNLWTWSGLDEWDAAIEHWANMELYARETRHRLEEKRNAYYGHHIEMDPRVLSDFDYAGTGYGINENPSKYIYKDL